MLATGFMARKRPPRNPLAHPFVKDVSREAGALIYPLFIRDLFAQNAVRLFIKTKNLI